MKQCKKCKEIKDINEFYTKKNSCKNCEIERVKKYQILNKEKISKRRKERYLENREEELKKKRKYDDENREKIREKARNAYDPEKSKLYYLENKEEILARNKEWSNKNKEYHRELNRENSKKWLKENPHVVVWRQILYRTIKKFNKTKESSTIEMLGYSAIDLKCHIESLFEEGMSWENWGEWHIDHIKPLATFDIDTQVNIVNSLNNLRPLWAQDNLRRKKRP
jgi:hypothetical protein